MKFTSKILAAAIASIAVLGSAHAATSDDNIGGGSVLLYVWDVNPNAPVLNQAYVLDTGLTYASLQADIASNTSVTVNAGGSSLFQSLFSSSEISGGFVDFSIIGGDNALAQPIAYSAGSQSPSYLAGVHGPGQLLGYQDNTIQNLTGTESNITALVAGNGNYQLYLDQAETQNNNSQTTTLLPSGATAEVYKAVQNPNTGSGRNSQPQTPTVTDTGDSITLLANGQFSFNAGSAPSPTPLPAAVWLFGSGLLGLFGVGRRRRHQA